MQLRKHITPVDIKTVGTYLASAAGLLGILNLIPLVASLIFGELMFTEIFLLTSALPILVGLIGLRFGKYRRKLELKDALIITALSYLLFSLIGAFPFLPVKPFIDGFFEAMSGFTTTGLTMINEDTLPKTLLFYRAYSQWIGGLGIIVISLAILLRPGKAAFKLYSSEFGQKNIMGSVVATSRVVIKVYLALTLIGFIAFILSGMNGFDALLYIMTTIPTGGFATHSQSIGYYSSPVVQLAVSLFMILGAVSFPLYYQAVKEGYKSFFQDPQVKGLVVILLISCALYFILFGLILDNLAPAIFQAATSITTTGFNTVDTGALSDASKFITIVLMIIGGATGSTAGGIKIFRFIALLGLFRWLIWEVSLPQEAKIPTKLGQVNISDREMKMIASFFTAYLIILVLSTILVMWCEGFNFMDSLFEVASAEGTVGLSVGITSSSLTVWSKLILIVNMWMGRLEIIPVLIALYPGTWLKSKAF